MRLFAKFLFLLFYFHGSYQLRRVIILQRLSDFDNGQCLRSAFVNVFSVLPAKHVINFEFSQNYV